MSKLPMIARLLLGLIFLVFGLNGFLNFIPIPPMPEVAGQFMGGLGASGYFFPMLKGLEVILSILLLANKKVPLALVILAPITVNILLFHAFLAPAGLPLPVLILVLHLYLAYVNKEAYKPLCGC